jgi:hypothetical protein
MSRGANSKTALHSFARTRRTGIAGLLSCALAAPTGIQAQDGAAAPMPAAPASAAVITTATITTTTVTTVTTVPAQREPLPAWTLATLPDEPVVFHGMVNMDNAGLGSGGMLYPTAGLGVLGLLVGIATHAALVGGSRSRQESQMQLAADKVLEPYAGVLAQFHQLDLERRALAMTPSTAVAHLFDVKQAPADEVFVLAVPAFAMTPDAAALVLDETVVVRPSATSQQGTQQVVRIVSAPRVEADVQAAWSGDNGAALKATAAQLMAQSLDIALEQSRHPRDDKAAFRTLRYALGDHERMERGQLLDETCERLVIRTLRGALLVVPHKAGAALPDGCPPAPAVAVRLAAPGAPSAANAASGAMSAAPAASAASAASAAA